MEEINKDNSFLIGITGGSGSGKTTFIDALRREFTEEELCIVSQDDYYRPRNEQQTDERGIKNFDIPYSIDLEEFYSDILKLLNGEIISRKEYVFNNKNAEPKDLIFKPAPVILVEGLFVFSDEKLRSIIDFKSPLSISSPINSERIS